MTEQIHPWPNEHGAPFLAWWDEASPADRRHYIETAATSIDHTAHDPSHSPDWRTPWQLAPFGSAWFGLNIASLAHRAHPDAPVDWQRIQDAVTYHPSRALALYDWIAAYPD